MFQKLKDLFIPCTENGFKPNFLERLSVGIMLVLILLSFAIANMQALLWIGSDWMVSTILPAIIVDLTNEERGGESLGTLRRSEVLDTAAQLKADDMAKYEYFAHYSPTGVSPWYWFDKASYNFIYAGENLAVHFTDSGEVVDAWMNSPSHRANIMNGNYTEIGVGTAKGEYKGFPTIFVVQLFGTPSAKAAPVNEEVAGAIALNETKAEDNISLETVALGSDATDTPETVAPATIQTITSTQPPAEIPSGEEIPEMSTTTQEETPLVVTPTYEETVVMYSDLATTSRPGIPAVVVQDENLPPSEQTHETTVLDRGATQSGFLLQIVYGFLALVVTTALILSIVIEWRRQNPIQIAYAGGLLAMMALLFYVHTALTSGVTII